MLDNRAISSYQAALRVALLFVVVAGLSLMTSPASAQYSTTWQDTFPGAAGSAPNPNNWGYILGDQFGNGEIDYGTNSRANSYLDGNNDLIIALLNNGANAPEQYTSAHLQTQGLVNVGPYGQVQADIECPGTDGIGEAFWALGSNFTTVGWPNCGEIDMMESHGSQADQSNGTIHAVGYADYGISAAYVNGSPLTQSFNVYGMYWMPYHIQFYFNGNIYSDLDVTKMASNVQWPFNQQIYLIDSAGVGGVVAGNPDTTTVFPQYMTTHNVQWNSWTAGVPAAPSNLTATSNSNSVTLNWTASATAGVTYNVYMNTVNSFTAGDLNTLEEYDVTGTTFTAGALIPGTTYYFRVVADSPGGESSPSNVVTIATQARGNAGAVRINCGGFGIGSFMRDGGVANLTALGNPASNPFPPTYNTSNVTNPAPNNVYDSYDWGASSFPINDLNANTLYTVRLHFCENQFNVVGGRVFNVFLNGNPVLQNFDIFKTFGFETVGIYQYTAMSDANGNVQIDTTLGSANDPLISAIEVIPDTGANTLPGVPGGLTASPASTNQISLTWNAVSGATGYNVFRSLAPNFTPSAATYAETVTATSVTDNVLYTDTTYYYKVAALNLTGEGQASGQVSATTQTSSTGVIAGVDCGGGASGAFAVDQDFSNGTTNTFTNTVNTSALSGSTIPSQAVLDTDREGTFNYAFSDLQYGRPVTVTLYFMENYWTAAGQREFNVTINNNQVLTNFDIYATAGAQYKAVQETFTTYVNNQGQINIGFSPTIDNAQCCGILLTQAPNPAVPSAPAAVAVDLASTATMTSWPASADPSIMYYTIYRGTTSGGEGTTPYASNFSGSNFEDTGLTNGKTYYYKVTATNWTGTSGSNETSAVPNPWPVPGQVFAANYNVGGQGVGYNSTATGNYGGFYRTNENVAIEQCQDTLGTQVPYDVSYESTGQWMKYTVNVAQTGSYNVDFRMSSYGGALFHLQDQNGNNLTGELVPPNTGGFQVWGDVTATINLTAGVQTLEYVEDGNTYNFHYMTFTYNGAAQPPAAPTGLTATAGNASVALAWSSSSNATSYNVYRGTSTGNESATPIATGLTGTAYTDSSVVNGTTYYYKVAAVDSAGASGLSNEASAEPEGAPVVEINCGGAAASPFVADEDFAGGATAAVTNTITTNLLTGTVPPQAVLQSNRYGAFTYTIPGLTAGASYPVTLYFAEEYWTAAGKRTFDVSINGAQVLTNFDIYATAGAAFAAVQENFTATANSSGQIVITTTNVIDNAQINGLVIGASNGSGGGGTAPPAPTGLTATAGNAQVALSWTASTGATSYNVYRSTTSGGEGTTAYATGITSTTYADTAAANGTTYYYTAAAVNASGTSAQSNQATATPEPAIPPAPTGLSAAGGNAQVSLSWTGSTGATSYNVYRGTSSGGESATALTTGLTGTTYTDSSVTNGTTYYYKVAAVNASGTSGQSGEASATPSAGASGSGGISINCGGAAASPFVADTDFTGGGTASVTNTITTNLLTGTVPPQAVLQSNRYGAFTYTITGLTANASYPVTLYFAEEYWTAAGKRVFDVSINGTQVLTNFDIYATAGAEYAAVQKSFTATASSSGQIVITTTNVTDNAQINGLVVGTGSGGGGGAAPSAPTGLTATGGNAQVALGWTASTGATSYNVYRGTTSGGESATALATGITGTTYTDTTAANGTTYYYKVAAVNASGTSGMSNEANATPSAGTTATVEINCGGAAASPFVADEDFAGGGTDSWTNTVATNLLTGTIPPQAVLQTDREGTFTYTLTGLTANSSHSVTLYFVEQYWTAAGKRVFSVTSNGTTEISNLDIYGTAGGDYIAIEKSFTTTANASGQIVLGFTPSVDQAKCSAIVID